MRDFWRSTGLEADEAERLAAAQVGGGAAGAFAGLTATAATAAPLGAAIGGTTGGTSTLALFSPIVTPIGAVPAGVAGTATSAGVDAPMAGGVAGAGGATAGAAGDVLPASSYWAGDLGQPIDFEISDVDQPAHRADRNHPRSVASQSTGRNRCR